MTKPIRHAPANSTQRVFLRQLPVFLCAVVAACLIFFVVQTWQWPLDGDAVSVHYLILLLRHGMAPYRQIVDAQMPGTYLIDWAVIHIFGGGRIGLRLFDYFLLAASMASMLAIARPFHSNNSLLAHRIQRNDNRCAAFLAAGLFALVHGRDGILQAGQRDLIMAVLLLAAYAFAFYSVRRNQCWLLGMSGFFASTAITIKPTVLPAAFSVLLLSLIEIHRKRRPLFLHVTAVFIGTALPLLAVAAFLMREHAIPAFLNAVRGMWPYYATLQRHGISFLLMHSYSPLLALVCIGLLLGAVRMFSRAQAEVASPDQPQRSWEDFALYAGLLLSLLSFIAQGKGFPYHRYPFLAFLLLVLMLEFSRAYRFAQSWSVRAIGMLGLVTAALFIAPFSTWKISHFDWRNDDYYNQLRSDIDERGGASLSGQIQCLDAFSGCIGTLYRMDLVQSTGFLVDFYLFGPSGNSVVEGMRAQFWQQLQNNPPRVFVVSKQVFPVAFNRAGEPLDTYDKLKQWPAFYDYLTRNYTLVEEHNWTRPVLWATHADHPAPYRIYVRKP